MKYCLVFRIWLKKIQIQTHSNVNCTELCTGLIAKLLAMLVIHALRTSLSRSPKLHIMEKIKALNGYCKWLRLQSAITSTSSAQETKNVIVWNVYIHLKDIRKAYLLTFT